MTIDDRQCWYNIAATSGLGPAAAQKIASYLESRRLGASALVDLGVEELQGNVGLSAGVAASLAEQLHLPVAIPEPPAGAVLVTPGDDGFPNTRFASANPPLPPVLWAACELSLLAAPGPMLAVAGSRDTTEEILGVVYEIAKDASRQGWVVVSGLAQGVDSAAHQGALAGRAGTVGVLASGIANASISWMPEDSGALCVVSQFSPNEPWSGPRAMQRNATIAGLADRVLVAAAGTSGGSWEMAQLCLRRHKPLFVLDLDAEVAPGNQKLIRAGAVRLDPDDPHALFADLDGPLTLFD